MLYNKRLIVDVQWYTGIVRAKVGICVPWGESPSRQALFDVTMGMYAEMFPDVKVYLGNQKKALHFNISASRNLACEAAIADGCEILIVSDADVLPVKSSIEEAIRLIESGEDFVIPHDDYGYLTEEATVDVLNGRDYDDSDFFTHGTWACGVIVISKGCFLALNGWDERFLSWGQEDDVFCFSYQKIYKKDPARVPGRFLSLYHENRDKTHSKVNENLAKKYYSEFAEDDIKLIKHLLRNRLDWA